MLLVHTAISIGIHDLQPWRRGEIAIRILSTARELGLHTIAIHTDNDQSHASHAHDTVQIPSAVSFQDIGQIVRICKKHAVDLVHPGYGFLSESAQFAEALQAAKIGFVGPSPEVLRQTGDKLKARKLAEACGVPVLPALTIATNNPGQVAEFARNAGYPIMLKAVDGGGGRGIRLVNHERELDVAFQRAVSESPSKSVFAEKAAIGGFRHIEVQVLGDGQQVRHFWERECSIQRR
jgi:biotin carboxylase